VGALRTAPSPSGPAPAAEQHADSAAAATADLTVADAPIDPAALAARAAAIADAASRSERSAVGQAPAAQRVTVRSDGHVTAAWTRAATVAELLGQLHVRLRAGDIVTPALSRAPAATVTVTRVVGKREVTRVSIAFPTTRVADGQLLKGHESVVRAGRAGVSSRVWQLTYRDGKLVKRTLVGTSVTAAPVTQVVHYGTRVPKPVSTSGVGGYPSFGGLNWYALARCESGNDPHSHDGPYRGLYQFMLGTWQSVGGSGDPADASIYEQTKRAWILYQREGRHPWPVCGKYL
jgi:hypothetical protein